MSIANKPILVALLSSNVADEFLTKYWPKRPFMALG
jgi:hypothetical protein